MKIISRSVLPLLAFMAVLGLGLAFTSPAEARQGHHWNNKSVYNCPAHGKKCGPDYRSGYHQKGKRNTYCAYYDRYHKGYNKGAYNKSHYNKGHYNKGSNYRYHH